MLKDSTLQGLRNTINGAHENSIKLKIELDEARIENERLSSHVRRLQFSFKQATDEKDMAEEGLNKLRSQTRTEMGDLRADAAETTSQLIQLQKIIVERDSALSIVEREKSELHRQNASLQSQLSNQQNRSRQLEQIVIQLENKLDTQEESDSTVERLNQKVQSLEDSNSVLQQYIERVQSSTVKKANNGESSPSISPSNVDLSELRRLQSHVTQMENERNRILFEMETQRETLHSVSNMLEETTSRLVESHSRIRSLESSNDDLKLKLRHQMQGTIDNKATNEETTTASPQSSFPRVSVTVDAPPSSSSSALMASLSAESEHMLKQQLLTARDLLQRAREEHSYLTAQLQEEISAKERAQEDAREAHEFAAQVESDLMQKEIHKKMLNEETNSKTEWIVQRVEAMERRCDRADKMITGMKDQLKDLRRNRFEQNYDGSLYLSPRIDSTSPKTSRSALKTPVSHSDLPSRLQTLEEKLTKLEDDTWNLRNSVQDFSTTVNKDTTHLSSLILR